jgi:hypothetical protein
MRVGWFQFPQPGRQVDKRRVSFSFETFVAKFSRQLGPSAHLLTFGPVTIQAFPSSFSLLSPPRSLPVGAASRLRDCDSGFSGERERGLRRGGGEDEPEPGHPGEAAARGGRARGDGGAQDRRGVPGDHGRVRGQLELPAREHHLHRQGACRMRSLCPGSELQPRRFRSRELTGWF